MSRIGKMPIAVPAGVDVTIDGSTGKGPKGQLVRTFSDILTITLSDGVLTVTRPDDSREAKSLHGLTRTLLSHMVEGVSTGFSKKLQLVGVGYRASKKGNDLEMQLGFSHPVSAKKKSVRLPPTSVNGANLSLIKARVFAMMARMYVVRPAKLARTKAHNGI